MDKRVWLQALLVLIAAVLGGTASGASGASRDRVTERGVLTDSAGTWTFDDVVDRPFAPYQTPYSQGNSRTPLWFRLVVPPQPAAETSLVLLVQPPVLREVTVYTSERRGGWARHELGSRYAFADRKRPDLNLTIDLETSTDEPTVIFLRVDSHTSTVHAEVITPDAARALDTHLHVVAGIYLGLALVFATLSAVLWWSTRDPVWGAASLFDLSTMVHTSVALGFLPKYLLPVAVDTMPWVFTLSATTHLATCCVVFALLVRALEAPRWAMLGYLVILPVYAVWLLMIAFGRLGETLVQVNLAILPVNLWGIVAMLTIRTPDRLLAWTYRIFASALIAYIFVWLLPLLRPGVANPLSLYPTLPSNLVTMLMVSLILARRTLLVVQERHRLKSEARDAEQRLKLEQAHHAETEGMLGMIMHEMKNPLASIRLASELLSSGRMHDAAEQEKRFRNIQEAVDGIDSVLNRCLDVDRLEQGALVNERMPEDIAELLLRWLRDHRQRERIHMAHPKTLQGHVDAKLLLLMLGNLVDNALKYSPKDQGVTLRVHRQGEDLQIEVRNRVGRAGWPDPARLFQKYYRSPTAQHGGGTGLGLYWVRRVSELVGGKVDYRRDEDDAVFTLRMPA